MKSNIPESISAKFESKYIFDLSKEYKEGRLVLIAYPYWEAYVCAETSDVWVRITPILNLIKGGIEVDAMPHEEKIPFSKGTLFEQEQTKFLKCSAFINLIPNNTKTLAETFKESHWKIVETLIFLGEDFGKLITSNPAMAYLIVNIRDIYSSFKISSQKVLLVRLIKTKQKEILGLANLPATESLRKIFLKIDILNISENQFIRFCKSIPKEGAESKNLLKLLSHLEVINANVMQLVYSNRDLLFRLSKSMIVELSNSANNAEYVLVLKRIFFRCQSVNIPFPNVKQISDLHQIDRDNFEKAKQKRILLEKFPKPPIEGNDVVIPLLNAREQLSWSKKQSNCIRGYSGKVKSNKSFFYKVIFEKEEATLEVKITKDKLFLGDILGRKNIKVSKELKNEVLKWFEKRTKKIEMTNIL